jgi:hypothetical protein
MNADAASLDAMGKLLIQRAYDLSWVGRKLASEAWNVNWSCAKADRYLAAMQARSTETKRLSVQMRELGQYLRRQAAEMDLDQAPRPDNEGM